MNRSAIGRLRGLLKDTACWEQGDPTDDDSRKISGRNDRVQTLRQVVSGCVGGDPAPKPVFDKAVPVFAGRHERNANHSAIEPDARASYLVRQQETRAA